MRRSAGKEAPVAASVRCGVELWAIKTLTDPAAKAIDWRPIDRTIAELAAEPPAHGSARTPFERHVYRIHATLTWLKVESDNDVHGVLEQGANSMIVELSNAACTRRAQHRYAMYVARKAVDDRWQPGPDWTRADVPVTVSGVGFLDRLHGQRGVAPNGVELHPVLSIR